ncbi:MAG: hypothetical protein CFE21_12470 [Bacteroidetes bacterium B1(2017)]|nr:MAG: hypothetical protein CFE21_12470 [Bacteroidetes bacterium B1(2017)]
MKWALFILFFSLFSLSINCQNNSANNTSQALQVNAQGKTVSSRFSAPTNYKRSTFEANSFEFYLSHLPLKEAGAKVLYFDGSIKPNQDVCAAVLDLDIGKRNLQQCADAVMRLRAEYLFKEKKYAQIHFNFTNGFRANYTDWAKGNRIKVSGNSCTLEMAKAKADYSYANFRKYLDLVFTYAGTLSLSKELQKKALKDLEIGDVFIYGGSPGHAVIVIDVAIYSKTGNKVFLLAQSYMPAQSIHVLVNPNNSKLSPWYSIEEIGEELNTPEWTFAKTDLKQFKEN